MIVTLAIVVAVALLALVAVEYAARGVLRRSGYYVWPPLYRRRIEVDPSVHPHIEPVVRFEVNSDGERGGPYPQGEGVLRILIAGGSAVECAFNDQDSAWPQRVEELLNRPESLKMLGARQVHVGNVARSGLDVRAVDLVLERILVRYGRLDVIAIMVGVGDILQWLEAGGDPNTPHAPRSIDAVFHRHPERKYGWRPSRLATLAAAKRILVAVTRPVETRARAGRWMTRAREMRQRAKEIRPTPPDASASLDLFERFLRSAIARSVAASSTVLVLEQPFLRKAHITPEEDAAMWIGGVGTGIRGDEITTFYSNEAITSLVDKFMERQAKVARELGVPLIETTPALPMDLSTFYDRVHLTSKGCAALAEPVAQGILDQHRREALAPS